MIEEEGVVVESLGGLAKVELVNKSGCGECSASGICRAGGGDLMEAANPLGAVKGQKVKVVLAPQVYLKASLILYGVPMAALVGGAIVAKEISVRFPGGMDSDLWAFLAGMSCLLVSFFGIRVYNNKVEKTLKYKPTIVEILI
jgi:sigma-E factor negative regulatory protein RseC